MSTSPNKDELRIKVCEALGWTPPHGSIGHWQKPNSDRGKTSSFIGSPPALTHDLMAEVLATMTDAEWERVIRNELGDSQLGLSSTIGGDWSEFLKFIRQLMQSTPEQQAVAFLKAKGVL